MSEDKNEKTSKRIPLGAVNIYAPFPMGHAITGNLINPAGRNEHKVFKLFATALFVEIIDTEKDTVWLVPYSNVRYCTPLRRQKKSGDDGQD
jgi:hypothetical protein